MSAPWAIVCACQQANLLAAMRPEPGLLVCEQTSNLWLRGENLDDILAHRLATIPGAVRFTILPDDQLVLVGKIVPHGHLPSGPWLPLATWLQVEFPPSQPAKLSISPMPLKLRRTGEMREPALLEVRLETLAQYAATAPQWRPERWQFVLGRDGTAIVRGLPLPPLPGRTWVETEGICVPVGFTWHPAVEAVVIRKLIGLEANQLALLDPAGTREVVDANQWVCASRSALRCGRDSLPS